MLIPNQQWHIRGGSSKRGGCSSREPPEAGQIKRRHHRQTWVRHHEVRPLPLYAPAATRSPPTAAHRNLGFGLAEGTEEDGTDVVWPRWGTREDAVPVAKTREEVGGRRRRRASGASPLPSAAAELSRNSQPEKSIEDEAFRSCESFPGDFRPFGVGNEPNVGRNSGGTPRNSGRIPGLISMPLQTPEFGSKFWNSDFQSQFRASKQGVIIHILTKLQILFWTQICGNLYIILKNLMIRLQLWSWIFHTTYGSKSQILVNNKELCQD
jgi:hypothetical protein